MILSRFKPKKSWNIDPISFDFFLFQTKKGKSTGPL